MTSGGHEENIWNDKNILYLNWLHGYKHVKKKTHQIVPSKWGNFSLFKLFFNKLFRKLLRGGSLKQWASITGVVKKTIHEDGIVKNSHKLLNGCVWERERGI